MPGAGMESLHNIRYNIHSRDSMMNSTNGYVRVDYHSKPDYYHQKPTEEGPIDFSLKTNSEAKVKVPEINIERHINDSENYHSGNTIANHLQDRNFVLTSGSMLEQHLRNGNSLTNGNQRTSSPTFAAAKLESKNYERTASPSQLNTQSIHKIYYETGEHRKASEELLNRSQTASSQFIKPFFENNVDHHKNEGHSPGTEYESVSALRHAGAQFEYSRNITAKKSETTVNGTFPTHEYPEKRSHSPNAIKREEYYSETVTNSKDFSLSKRHSAGATFSDNKNPVKMDDAGKTNRNECSGIQSNYKNSYVQSKYGPKEISNAEPDTNPRFQPLLSANASPFVPNVYNNMGIMSANVSSNFPHLNPLAYPPAMLSSFNPFLSANPLTHPLNPMSSVNFERKGDKNDRPFKQFANELIYGMQTLLPVKPQMIDKSYPSITEPTSSTLSPQSEKKISPDGRSLSAERCSPSAVPQNSQLTPSDESANSASPTYHENDSKHSQSEQKEDVDSNNAKEEEKDPNDSNSSFSDAMPNNQQPADTSCGNGKRRSLPEHMKNDLYWAKRRKNNAAAKRSRDARRKKEDMLAITAKTLRDQNYQLQILMAAMQEQITFQTTENKRLSEKCNNQEIQIFRLKEDQERNQKLCRRCSARILDVDSPGNGL